MIGLNRYCCDNILSRIMQSINKVSLNMLLTTENPLQTEMNRTECIQLFVKDVHILLSTPTSNFIPSSQLFKSLYMTSWACLLRTTNIQYNLFAVLMFDTNTKRKPTLINVLLLYDRSNIPTITHTRELYFCFWICSTIKYSAFIN